MWQEWGQVHLKVSKVQILQKFFIPVQFQVLQLTSDSTSTYLNTVQVQYQYNVLLCFASRLLLLTKIRSCKVHYCLQSAITSTRVLGPMPGMWYLLQESEICSFLFRNFQAAAKGGQPKHCGQGQLVSQVRDSSNVSNHYGFVNINRAYKVTVW